MRFATHEDIDQPREAVFAAVSDFESFERAAMRRGADIRRLGEHVRKGIGQGWHVHFPYRGRSRELVSEITVFKPPCRLASLGGIGGIDCHLDIELIALAPARTRLKVDLVLKPRTMGARLLVQSLKLARGALAKGFKSRVHGFARRLERGKPPR